MMTTTMKVKDEWVRTAMTDDNVVVELLVRLKQAQAAPPAPKSAVAALKWGIRQPRSRPMLMRCDAKKDGDFSFGTRGSPTTPLSWSGGGGAASPSAADDFEETSKQPLRSPSAATSRSKGTAGNETNSSTTKRSRKKKSFAELKEEENLLLKERNHLKKEIASMRATCKEQRARNENLKRIKLDLNLHTAKNLTADESEKAPSCQPPQRVPSSFDCNPSTLPSHVLDDCKPMLDSSSVDKATSSGESFFLLPDLNMVPAEDDSGAETLYGTS
ncbi:hypothetical protein DITRI_Ditri10aG0134400 [Diplodiscus trichospermus]